ncbi:MAG: biopolymer transporter ExbD [Rickettsiales bacterium]
MIKVKQSERAEIFNDFIPDLTPLLDVLFILIFFLILTTNTLPYKIDLELPQDKEDVAEVSNQPNNLIIKILAENKGWFIAEQKFVDFANFKNNLISNYQKNQQQVVIMSEPQVAVEQFIDLLLFLQKNNIQTADILVQK